MQQGDTERFRSLLIGMGRLFAQEPDALVLDAYWVALREWKLEDFEAACARLMKTCRFMPRPADFTEIAKAGKPTAGEAWDYVLCIVRKGDFYGFSRSHTDPRVEAAVRAIGGYRAIGNSHTDQTHFLERRFCEHYEAISDAEDIRKELPQIAGEPRLAPRALPYDKRRLTDG